MQYRRQLSSKSSQPYGMLPDYRRLRAKFNYFYLVYPIADAPGK